MSFGNLMASQPRGRGSHSLHILRRATEDDIKAFRWLSPSFHDVREAFENLEERIVTETCGWIVSNDTLRNWFHSPSTAALQIIGDVGCGKSLLSAYLVRHVRASPQVEGERPREELRDYSVASFYKQELGPRHWDDLYDVPQPLAFVFCDELPAEGRTLEVVLGLLLTQICRQSSEVLSAVTRRMMKSPVAVASLPVLKVMFQDDVSQIMPGYFLIIDGIERIEDATDFFCNLMQQARNHVKLLITARQNNVLAPLENCLTISMNPAYLREDATLIATETFGQKLLPQTQDFQAIAEHVLQGDKTLLWFDLATKILEIHSCSPASRIEQLSSNVPAEINSLYSLAYNDLASIADPVKRCITFLSLHILAVSQRPLDLFELKTVLSLAQETRNSEYDRLVAQLKEILESDGKAFVRITTTSVHGSMYSVISRTVSLIHPSVQDFLFFQHSDSTKLDLPLSREILHASMARICLRYLSLPPFADTNTRFQFQRGSRHNRSQDDEGFISYAAIYVFEHLSYSGSAGRDDIQLLQDLQVFMQAEENVKTWANFVASCYPIARLAREYRMGTLRYDDDIFLPGLGHRFSTWIDGFANSKNAEFREVLGRWYRRLLSDVLDDGDRLAAHSSVHQASRSFHKPPS